MEQALLFTVHSAAKHRANCFTQRETIWMSQSEVSPVSPSLQLKRDWQRSSNLPGIIQTVKKHRVQIRSVWTCSRERARFHGSRSWCFKKKRSIDEIFQSIGTENTRILVLVPVGNFDEVLLNLLIQNLQACWHYNGLFPGFLNRNFCNYF